MLAITRRATMTMALRARSMRTMMAMATNTSIATAGGGGEDPAGDGQGSKEKVAAALAAKWSGKIDNKSNVKRDKDGHPMVVGDTVMCYATKQKDKYDKRVAKVERLNTDRAVVTILEGPAQGEKRKVARALGVFEKRSWRVVPPLSSLWKIPLQQAMSGQWRRAPRRLTPCATF